MVRDDQGRNPADAESAPHSSSEDRPTALPHVGDVTLILSQIEQGDGQAAEQLLPLVYNELRKLAAAKMAQEKPGQTLQATALVHEAYLRLVDQTTPQRWDTRRHFFAAAAEAMRRILVEQARRKGRLAAGGGYQRVELSQVEPEVVGSELDVLALNDALEQLTQVDARAAQLVTLRFFAGLTNQEAADALAISASTAYEDWDYAKSWLRVALLGAPEGNTDF